MSELDAISHVDKFQFWHRLAELVWSAPPTQKAGVPQSARPQNTGGVVGLKHVIDQRGAGVKKSPETKQKIRAAALAREERRKLAFRLLDLYERFGVAL